MYSQRYIVSAWCLYIASYILAVIETKNCDRPYNRESATALGNIRVWHR